MKHILNKSLYKFGLFVDAKVCIFCGWSSSVCACCVCICVCVAVMCACAHVCVCGVCCVMCNIMCNNRGGRHLSCGIPCVSIIIPSFSNCVWVNLWVPLFFVRLNKFDPLVLACNCCYTENKVNTQWSIETTKTDAVLLFGLATGPLHNIQSTVQAIWHTVCWVWP